MLDEPLTQEEWELALQVVHQAWQNADGELVELEIPQELQHLDKEDWEEVCRVLSLLEYQQAFSELH